MIVLLLINVIRPKGFSFGLNIEPPTNIVFSFVGPGDFQRICETIEKAFQNRKNIKGNFQNRENKEIQKRLPAQRNPMTIKALRKITNCAVKQNSVPCTRIIQNITNWLNILLGNPSTFPQDRAILYILLSSIQSYEKDYNNALAYVKSLDKNTKEGIFHTMFKNIEFFDSPSREFEFPDITFQAVISASNFAQLKRHRMASFTYGDYNIELGNTLPENIKINGMENEFLDIIENS